MKDYEKHEVACMLTGCMNNRWHECQLLHEAVKGKRCPFYKTAEDNIAECMRLGVQSWQEIRSNRS